MASRFGPVEVVIETATLRLRADETLDFGEARRIAAGLERVDVVLLLTEIPRRSCGEALTAEVFPDEEVAVISCPTLGVLSVRRRLLAVIVDVAERVLDPDAPDRSPVRWTRWTTGTEARSGHPHDELRSPRTVGGVRTVLGMVSTNDPWRTAPSLSGVFAAACATGAFGLFYSSIWQMSMYQSTARLLAIAVAAVVLMVLWLILSNRLWDRPVTARLSTVVMLYNASTVLTLALAVIALYVLLFVLILAAALVVIDPRYLAQELQQGQAGFTNYLSIAWLSAAMGVVAGGLGSSFDSSVDVRRLTHGQRERQRQFAAES